MKLKISTTIKLIGFSILGIYYVGPVIFLGYFILDLSLRMV